MKEINYYQVHMIDREGLRWYSPNLVKEYSNLEETKLRVREALSDSKEFIKAEISVVETKVVATLLR